jgi:hypothetical protein
MDVQNSVRKCMNSPTDFRFNSIFCEYRIKPHQVLSSPVNHQTRLRALKCFVEFSHCGSINLYILTVFSLITVKKNCMLMCWFFYLRRFFKYNFFPASYKSFTTFRLLVVAVGFPWNDFVTSWRVWRQVCRKVAENVYEEAGVNISMLPHR